MTARDKTELLQLRAERAGVALTWSQANTLRRAALVLSRWAELECGDEYGRCIERDDETGRPYLTYERGPGERRGRVPVADREAGALRRVAAVCKEAGCHYYHQGDPRGASLYIGAEPLTEQGYYHGVCCEL